MMVHVTHEDRVTTPRRKIGSGRCSLDDADIRKPGAILRVADLGQPLWIDIRTVDVPGRCYVTGDGNRQIAASGADVGDVIPGPNLSSTSISRAVSAASFCSCAEAIPIATVVNSTQKT
jgi:hypothetical protein